MTAALAVLAALVLARPVLALVRLALAPAEARRHYLPAVWHTCGPRWRMLTKGAGLAVIERHHRRAHPWLPVRPLATSTPVADYPAARLRWPRVRRLRVDPYGWQVECRTIPKCGRAEIAAQAQHIADQWRACRVAVQQDRAGYVTIRACRRDPLLENYHLGQAPAAHYALDPMAPRPWTWHLGRDEWGRERFVPLAQLPAFTVAGMPGFGKTVLASGLLYQFSPSPLVRVMLLADGKGGGDYLAWDGRAEMVTGEDLAGTADALADVHRELLRRLGRVVPELGVRNAWRVGPSREWPLGLTLLDEIHTYTDLDMVRGDRDAEKLVRHCRRFVSELVRKGRSVMMLTGCLDQHMTIDALPSGIRDAAPLALSFATRTTAKSVAALSEDIRQYPDFDPALLQDEQYRGVLVAAIRTGLDPYCRIRVPEITEDAAAERAALTAPLRQVLPDRPHLRALP